MAGWAGGVKTPLNTVSITGTAKVGQTLTAVVNPAVATVSCKWKAAAAADGTYTDIAGATGKTFVLTAAQQGKFIKVEVTGTNNYEGTKLSTATTAVAAQA